MEEALRERVGDLKTTRVVCRSGQPGRCPTTSSGPPSPAPARSSSSAATTATPAWSRPCSPCVPSTASWSGPTSSPSSPSPTTPARIRAVTDGRVLTVSSDDVVAEVTAQACLQSGLAAVFTDLLDFDGDEIYFTRVPELAGHTYREALVGLRRRARSSGGSPPAARVELNPAAETRVRPPATSSSSSPRTTRRSRSPACSTWRRRPPAVPTVAAGRPMRDRASLVGWSGFGAKVLQELDEFLPAGSTVDVVADRDLVDADAIERHHARATPPRRAPRRRRPRGTSWRSDRGPAARPGRRARLPRRARRSTTPTPARSSRCSRCAQAWPAAGATTSASSAELLDQRNLVAGRPGRRRRPDRQRRALQPADGAALRAGRAAGRVRRPVRRRGRDRRDAARAPSWSRAEPVAVCEPWSRRARPWGRPSFGYRLGATGRSWSTRRSPRR